MTYLEQDYQPSLLQLARQGNYQAIAYWMNTLLLPQGITIQTKTSRSGHLDILVNFHRITNPKRGLGLQKRLVRMICYRLWTLNSAAIRDVRISARMAGNPQVLWKQTVRIKTPANSVDRPRAHSAAPKNSGQFQVLRSFLVSRLAFAGFVLCYWLIYLETMGHKVGQASLSTPTAQQTIDPSLIPQGTAESTPSSRPSQASGLTFTAPKSFRGQVVYDIQPANEAKVVALTFDDGPWENTTEQILDILRQENIKATFFFVGQAIQANPDVAKKVAAEGHTLGNHTWRHYMDNMDEATAIAEIGNAAKLLYETTGARTALFRPPGGNLGGRLVDFAKELGYTVMLWSADSSDYMVSTPLIIDNVLRNTRPGGIILLHDGGGDRRDTVAALPQIIASLKQQGYRFVTVPDLLRMHAPKPDSTSDGHNPTSPQLPTIRLYRENPGSVD
jgi:peptidoglycan/xylan/chitin deacetylase (PgdA/CDA1 family)